MCVIWGSQQREGTFCLISWNQTASRRQLMLSVTAAEGGAAHLGPFTHCARYKFHIRVPPLRHSAPVPLPVETARSL